MNKPAIKGSVMFVMGLLDSAVGGLTGLGTQVAAAPQIDFLLGYTPERTAGTSTVFALVAAASAAIAAGVAGLHVATGRAVLLAVAAFAGALATARLAQREGLSTPARIAHSFAMLLCVYLITSSVRGPLGWPIPLDVDFFRTLPGWLLVGVACGAVSGAFKIANGVLLIPALIFLCGVTVPHAIITSLVVICAAALLPALSHVSLGRVDQGTGAAMILGGLLGGALGGYVLARVPSASPLPLALFAFIAMFLSGWTVQRNS